MDMVAIKKLMEDLSRVQVDPQVEEEKQEIEQRIDAIDQQIESLREEKRTLQERWRELRKQAEVAKIAQEQIEKALSVACAKVGLDPAKYGLSAVARPAATKPANGNGAGPVKGSKIVYLINGSVQKSPGNFAWYASVKLDGKERMSRDEFNEYLKKNYNVDMFTGPFPWTVKLPNGKEVTVMEQAQ